MNNTGNGPSAARCKFLTVCVLALCWSVSAESATLIAEIQDGATAHGIAEVTSGPNVNTSESVFGHFNPPGVWTGTGVNDCADPDLCSETTALYGSHEERIGGLAILAITQSLFNVSLDMLSESSIIDSPISPSSAQTEAGASVDLHVPQAIDLTIDGSATTSAVGTASDASFELVVSFAGMMPFILFESGSCTATAGCGTIPLHAEFSAPAGSVINIRLVVTSLTIGTVPGTDSSADSRVQFSIEPTLVVPLPAPAALLLTGMLGIALVACGSRRPRPAVTYPSGPAAGGQRPVGRLLTGRRPG